MVQCDGVRPKCNTCQSKNLTCVYDVAEDGKTTTQLRAHVRRLAKELDDMKSVVSLLAMAPDRASAANWASGLQKNGFAHHSAEEVKKARSVLQTAASRLLAIRILWGAHRTAVPLEKKGENDQSKCLQTTADSTYAENKASPHWLIRMTIPLMLPCPRTHPHSASRLRRMP